MARKPRTITHNGETLTLSEWAKRIGCSTEALHGRLKMGWPTERVVTTPIGCGWSSKAEVAFDTLVRDIDHALRVYQTAADIMKRSKRKKRKMRGEVRAGRPSQTFCNS